MKKKKIFSIKLATWVQIDADSKEEAVAKCEGGSFETETGYPETAEMYIESIEEVRDVN